MIEERKENKYSNDNSANSANAKKNSFLVKIRNTIKIYIYSEQLKP
jgi:hypothetical protein